MVENKLDDQSKIQILINALNERYKSIHVIRDRLQNVCLWSLGILLTATGWLIQSNILLTLKQKIVYTIFILIAFIILRFFYFRDLNKGFKNQQQVLVRVEKALQLYRKGIFDSSDSTIYPESWKSVGTKDSEGQFFYTSYLLLYTGIFLLLLAIWLKGFI